MEFGLQFFPTVDPNEVSGETYWSQCLELVSHADEWNYTHIRTVEHYFHRYGGYSPNPLLFLTAASQRTKKARLITGAVLPVFNNPLKLAGEIGMLDAISNGRLEVGFARAFLPHEFVRFGVSLDESKDRFAEGMEQVRLLLEEEHVTSNGRFHSLKDTTSLPRPTQKPRPPFWVAAISTPDSFINAGKAGHSIMAIPLAADKMKDLLGLYRDAWQSAGHRGRGRVMLAFHMLCWPDESEAMDLARAPINGYLETLVEGASGWLDGATSADYPGYDKIIATLKADNFESTLAKGGAWVGTPKSLRERIESFVGEVGDFEIASLQVNFHTLDFDVAKKSAELFAQKVIPHFAVEGLAA